MTQAGWIKYALTGLVLSAILFGILGTVIWAIVLAYGWLGAITGLTLAGVVWWAGGMFFGWWGRGGWSFGWGSSFGWFGWGSFGWGWGWWGW